jgi:hypothetical protein
VEGRFRRTSRDLKSQISIDHISSYSKAHILNDGVSSSVASCVRNDMQSCNIESSRCQERTQIF